MQSRWKARRLLETCAVAFLVAGCSGGGSSGPAPVPVAPATGATGIPSAAPTLGGKIPAPTPTPASSHAPTPIPSATATPSGTKVGFAGWNTYGYDNHRDGFNPNTTAITPASIGQLHLGWQSFYNDFNTQSQPVLAANIPGHRAVLFVGGGNGFAYAYDGTTGLQMWKTFLGQTSYTCGSSQTPALFGVAGSFVYDAGSQTIFVPANSNTSADGPAMASVVRLSAANGSQIGHIDAAPNALPGELNFAHTSLALANGRIYLGTSATCDLSSWRGRVAAVDTNLTTVQTFFTAWSPTAQYSGGGVWGEGGVSVDDVGNVYTGVGNADTNSGIVGSGNAAPQPPFISTSNETAGFGENFIKLPPDLSGLLANNLPSANGGGDTDLTGSPMLFKPFGCSDTLASLQGKAGQLLTYDTQSIGSGPVSRPQISPSGFNAPYLGNPGYSPITGLMYASVETGVTGFSAPGIVAFKPTGCGLATTLPLVWKAPFGPDSNNADLPRSAISVTAGGVVFVGTPCTPDGTGGCQPTAISSGSGGAMWAVDATTGTVLNGGKPLVITGDVIRMAPVIDGNWVFVTDNSANLYGFTTDPSVPAKVPHRAYANRQFSLSTMRRR